VLIVCSRSLRAGGSAWALYLLDYRLSTAVWVGVIALVGLAAQTGVVMIVYIDHAFERGSRPPDPRNRATSSRPTPRAPSSACAPS
jgi:Cu(I)/Ag(I) efflux system membrane protein CusA/SilA